MLCSLETSISGFRGSLIYKNEWPRGRTVHPTSLFTVLALHELEIDEFYVAQERRSRDFEGQKIVKGFVGQRLNLQPALISLGRR